MNNLDLKDPGVYTLRTCTTQTDVHCPACSTRVASKQHVLLNQGHIHITCLVCWHTFVIEPVKYLEGGNNQ